MSKTPASFNPMIKLFALSLPWKESRFHQNGQLCESYYLSAYDYIISVTSGHGEPGKSIHPKGWNWRVVRPNKDNFDGWSLSLQDAKLASLKVLFNEMMLNESHAN